MIRYAKRVRGRNHHAEGMILNVPTDMPPTQEGAIPKNEDRETERNIIYTTAERDDNGSGAR